MSRNNMQICRCCLRVLKKEESWLQTNENTCEIFRKFIGLSLLPGIICEKCYQNLRSFEVFQREIRRMHDEIGGRMQVRQETGYFPVTQASEELMEESDMVQALLANGDGLVEAVLAEVEENVDAVLTEVEENDDDVIFISEGPQMPIDLDPQPKPDALEIIYKCDHCTAVSAQKEIIIRHIKQSHVFRCGTCAKVCPTEELIKEHDLKRHKAVVEASSGSKRKQSMKTVRLTAENLQFRMHTSPHGIRRPRRTLSQIARDEIDGI
jgi:ferredoxin